MKKSLIFAGMLVVGYANAQETNGRVGVNTDAPKATLDVKSISSDAAKGILTPQMTGDELQTMTANLTADQNGLIVFVTSGVTTPDTSTNNVQFAGYHRFNISGTEKSWTRLEPSGLEKIKGNGTDIGWRLVGHAENSRYVVVGNRAIDMGFATEGNTEIGPSGTYSVVMGPNNRSTNWGSFALGERLYSSGRFSVAMGLNNQAIKDYSFVVGANNQATGIGAVTFGQNNKANNNYAFVTGLSSEATHPYATAMGYSNKSKGEGAVALGGSNDVTGTRAIALGNSNIITGSASFAAGFRNEVLKNYGVALGFRTVSSVEGMVAVGSSNTLGGKLFVVGNGNRMTDDSLLERSDAFTILQDGKVGIDIDNFETTTQSAKLQVNGEILSSSLAGTGNRVVYADENGVLKVGNAYAANTTNSLWTRDEATNTIKLAVNSDGTDRTNAVTIDNAGAVYASSLKGYNGATIFPDYVFQKYYTGNSSIKADYTFKTLSQVEDFVKANGHLPGYKSAEAIKAQGYVDLMETQLTNVEKIEELYLHSIEQEKNLKELRKENEELKTRLEKLEKLLK